MKRVVFTVLFLLIFYSAAFAQDENAQLQPVLLETSEQQPLVLPNIFIYSPPTPTGNEVKLNDSDTVQVNETVNPYIRYDDSSVARYDYSLPCDEAVELSDVKTNSLNLKKAPNTSGLNNANLNLSKYKNNQTALMPIVYRGEEYSIQPLSKREVEQMGNFKYGTLYGAAIDTSQLEYSAGLFTRYERKHFALSTAYQKNQGTAYGLTTDNFYIAPELKLNKTFSISNVMKADTTRNRRSSELVLKIKPFANKGNDRLNLEFGAGQTYDQNNELYKTQFRFNTNFKL